MESIGYELINQRIGPSKIQSNFYSDNKVFYSIEKTAEGEQVYFFNPEYDFEKQRLVNADARKVFTYLKAQEKNPEQYEQFLQKGFVFIQIDNAYSSLFVMHIFK